MLKLSTLAYLLVFWYGNTWFCIGRIFYHHLHIIQLLPKIVGEVLIFSPVEVVFFLSVVRLCNFCYGI